MIPLKNITNNMMLNAPSDWDRDRNGECVGLPVTVNTKDEVTMIHSFWTPSEVDISNILAGVPVRLTVFGSAHPPVMLTVTNKAD